VAAFISAVDAKVEAVLARGSSAVKYQLGSRCDCPYKRTWPALLFANSQGLLTSLMELIINERANEESTRRPPGYGRRSKC
jgi:hypothetical protein